MRGIGIGMALAHMRNKKPTQQCGRCGLRYEIDKEECPHCHSLSDEEVNELKDRIEREHIGNRKLGTGFIIAALAIAALILLVTVVQ